MNAVRGLREANNKIYTAAYYDPDHDFIPITHVSKDVNYLKQIIEESDQEQMIMKPLDGYGGRGVIIIEKSASKNIKSFWIFMLIKVVVMVNHNMLFYRNTYPDAEKGDVRVFMLNGRTDWCFKKNPFKRRYPIKHNCRRQYCETQAY